jgi:pimeloyl-ACP methyl ester carboxylesterase
MKNLFLLGFLLFIAFTKINAQLISYEKIDSFTISELQTKITNLGYDALITAEYPVDLYRVIHNTEYKNGMTEISGLLAIPAGTVCKAPLIAYQHGTTVRKLGVPSYNSAEKNIALFFASEGSVVCASDYIGLGSSTVDLHPYMHAYSQAHSTINLLRSVKTLNSELSLNLGNQLFLFGYSQGGFATAAVAKYIETWYSEEFNVTAAVPMSGPYNMAGAQFEMVNSGLPYATPGYLPYVILSYQSMYGNLYNEFSDIFKSPYDSLMPYHIVGHNYGFGTINPLCTPSPIDMIKDSVLNVINTDLNHPFRQALQDNDFLDWTPETPMKLIYCTGDDQVSYLNGVIADSVWNANGANHIEGENWGNYDHGGCFQFALISGKQFLESYFNHGVPIFIEYDENNNSYTVDIADDDIANYDILWNDQSTGRSISNIEPGTSYVVSLTHKTNGCHNSKSFKLNNVLAINNLEANMVFDVFPNPANKVINVSFTGAAKDLYIIDVLGKIVHSQTLSEGNTKVEISKLNKGIYFVGMNGVKSKRKLVVE